MKKTIIPAGTPGIFRPGHGQYPEAAARIIAWQPGVASYLANGVAAYPTRDWADSLTPIIDIPSRVYAWQYAPTPPPVDDFEAWCQGWRINEYNGMYSCGRYDWFPLKGRLNHNDETLDFYPTLIEAQRAAYQHFLQTLNEE